jgi:hypothetical protein
METKVLVSGRMHYRGAGAVKLALPSKFPFSFQNLQIFLAMLMGVKW